MSNVIKFTPKVREVSLVDIAVDTHDDLLGEWERAIRVNRLNDYAQELLPHARENASYTSDLNDLAMISEKLGFFPAIFSPGALEGTRIPGWVVIFKVHDQQISTPPMATEAYARLFGLLLQTKMLRELKRLGQ